jgi:hypothetical protein
VSESLPKTDYHGYFEPDFSLNVDRHRNMEDWNTKTVGDSSQARLLPPPALV